MCIETPGVPPLLPAAERGANDRIPPEELTPIGGTSVGWVSVPVDGDGDDSGPILVQCH